MTSHRIASLGAALLLAGCYSYRPLHTVPEPGTYVVFDLTDRGRAPDDLRRGRDRRVRP
jgi:hypothetical protein